MKTSLLKLLPTFSKPILHVPRVMGPALVMGSAPNFRLPKGYDADWALVTVNASQLLAETFGLRVPDLAVIRRGILVDSGDQDFYKRDLLKGRQAKHLIIPVWTDVEDKLKAGCRTFNYRYDTLQALTKWQLANIVWRLSGKYHVSRGWYRKISTGVFAIMLARFAGFAPVVVSGFSLSQAGHGYDTRNAFRYHADEDADLLRRVVRRGEPIYAEDRDFAAESGLPLWQGQMP
ncbi:Membrane-anchored protein [Mesorhizobium sp. SOD10]|nr:Membrane-anchored protein [Mesorhizobium sp. SOD10]